MTHKQITQLARDLRKNQTPSEKLLWQNIRNRKLNGLKFNRQFPIIYEYYKNKPLFIIVDFYCHQHKLILELDGKIHDYQQEYDAQRDYIVENLGYKVLRLKNEELEDLEKVKRRILTILGN